MADNRTVAQRLAAVAASMTMAGYTMTEVDRAESRRILRGEVSADESVRRVLADAGRDAADLVGKTAFRRLSELESSRPLTVFTRETLLKRTPTFVVTCIRGLGRSEPGRWGPWGSPCAGRHTWTRN